MLRTGLIALAACAQGASARKLWATEPADPDNIIMSAYPLGNGKLGGWSGDHFAWRQDN